MPQETERPVELHRKVQISQILTTQILEVIHNAGADRDLALSVLRAVRAHIKAIHDYESV
jgi:hypothetical protein